MGGVTNASWRNHPGVAFGFTLLFSRRFSSLVLFNATPRSWSRLLGAASIAAAGAFLAVSPNNAPRDRYLALFRRNLGLIVSCTDTRAMGGLPLRSAASWWYISWLNDLKGLGVSADTMSPR